MHPAITTQIISDMQERRIRRAAEHARAGNRPSRFLTAVRARFTARRAAAARRAREAGRPAPV